MLSLTPSEVRYGTSKSFPFDRCAGAQAPLRKMLNSSPIETYLAVSWLGGSVEAVAEGSDWRGSGWTLTSGQNKQRRRRYTAGTTCCALISSLIRSQPVQAPSANVRR